jgi:hypothetical protein
MTDNRRTAVDKDEEERWWKRMRMKRRLIRSVKRWRKGWAAVDEENEQERKTEKMRTAAVMTPPCLFYWSARMRMRSSMPRLFLFEWTSKSSLLRTLKHGYVYIPKGLLLMWSPLNFLRMFRFVMWEEQEYKSEA